MNYIEDKKLFIINENEYFKKNIEQVLFDNFIKKLEKSTVYLYDMDGVNLNFMSELIQTTDNYLMSYNVNNIPNSEDFFVNILRRNVHDSVIVFKYNPDQIEDNLASIECLLFNNCKIVFYNDTNQEVDLGNDFISDYSDLFYNLSMEHVVKNF